MQRALCLFMKSILLLFCVSVSVYHEPYILVPQVVSWPRFEYVHGDELEFSSGQKKFGVSPLRPTGSGLCCFASIGHGFVYVFGHVRRKYFSTHCVGQNAFWRMSSQLEIVIPVKNCSCNDLGTNFPCCSIDLHNEA